MSKAKGRQAELNIGLFGHVDHGKTTLVKALTGKWTDTHSDEMVRGITIKIGYADADFYRCKECGRYSTEEKCPYCGAETEFQRRVAFVDAPGHESLMAIAISASSVIDGALLLIAANEKCPQEQTKEHLMLLELLGIKHIVIVQTKLDLVSKERALQHYREIKEFVKGTIAENAPIIPVSAHYKINIDKLIEAIEKYIPTPKRDEKKEFKAYIIRSFDVNKPGTPIAELKGGVIGGAILQGKVRVGDEIEISPGLKEGNKWRKIVTKVVSLREENQELEEARPGGLIAIGTPLDPALTKADQLAGHVVKHKGKAPEATNTLKLRYQLVEREDMPKEPIREKEPLFLNIHGFVTAGVVVKATKDTVEMVLKRAVAVEKGEKVAINRRVGQRWKLAGIGFVE